MSITKAIGDLDALLRHIGATPRLDPERVTRSTLYDPDYHVAMVACALNINAEGTAPHRKILRGWLKLLQFVAARPRLAPDLQRWVSTRRQQDLESWRRMPRGYLGDQTHDAVVDMLVAKGALQESGDYLLEGANVALLDSLFNSIGVDGLFETQRLVMEDLKTVKVSKALLGGQ